MITRSRLFDLCPFADPRIVEGIAAHASRELPKWGIDTPLRIAHFLGQIAYESSEFRSLEENLSYSATRLMEVWPSRFPSISFARQYERNPEKLANYVYAGRLGNGPTASGDGWRYRGRGLKQTTGLYNYTALANRTGLDVVQNPDLLLEFPAALISACVFWADNGLNRHADRDDATGLTLKINGGTHGLSERMKLTNRAKEIFTPRPLLLRRGDSGFEVEVLQQALNRELTVKITGVFDEPTDRLVRAFQFSRGLTVDGIVGPQTLQALSS